MCVCVCVTDEESSHITHFYPLGHLMSQYDLTFDHLLFYLIKTFMIQLGVYMAII